MPKTYLAQVEGEVGPIDVLLNSAGAARRFAPDALGAAAFHQGMDADPRKTYKALRDGEFPQSDIIFWLKETSQFYSTWQVLICPQRTTVSSNSFSHDQQVDDAWGWLRGEMSEDDWDLLVERFPEMERGIVWSGSYFDTEAMGVDVEYTSWVADALDETGGGGQR
jgi:hypothetical protein